MSFAIQIWPWKGQLGMYVFETGLKRLWNQTLRCCMIDTNYEFFKGTRKLSTQTCNSKKSCDCYSTCSLHATQTFARTIRITYNSKSVAIRAASIEIILRHFTLHPIIRQRIFVAALENCKWLYTAIFDRSCRKNDGWHLTGLLREHLVLCCAKSG